MTERQFLWGLSGGVSVFAIAGAFWFGLAFSSVLTPRTEWWVWSLSTGLQVGACAGLLWAGVRLRRRSGFRASELRHRGAPQQGETRHLRVGFAWTTVGQTLLIALGVWWCVRTDRQEMIWPWIGLIVGLHLVPLARLFHVRAYYVSALAGSIISLVSFTGLTNPHNLAYLGGGMAAVMWLSAAYLVWNADRITSDAVREPWAVSRRAAPDGHR
jgi:ABC-type nickel/cobalt efflux system permease component RcnA